MLKIVTLASCIILGACSLFGDAAPSIAGSYTLIRVDSGSPPCCIPATPSPTRTTTLSGSLVLGRAAPEAFAVTPAGYYPSSCVHAVPNGAVVNDADFPRCGDGDYTLTLTQRIDSAGSSRTATVTSVGRYAWSDKDELIKLMDASMLGTIVPQNDGALLKLEKVNFMGTYGEALSFAPAR